MLLKCKAVAERAGLDSEKFDLKNIPFNLCNTHVAVRIRCANGSALDGAQIVRDDHAISGTGERCSRPT